MLQWVVLKFLKVALR